MRRNSPTRYTTAGLLVRPATLSLNTLASRALIIATALNLNGLFSMAFDQGQFMSLLILVTSTFLVLRLGQAAFSGLMLLFIAAVVAYLLLGALFTQSDEPFETILAYGQTYVGTLLITWAIASAFVASARRGEGPQFIRFVRDAFVVSAIAVWASPWLYRLYVNAPLSMADRMGGFFGNPNEAGAAAAAGLAFVLGQPYRSRVLTLAAIAVCTGAIALTFSKTAISIGIVILALAALRMFRGPAMLLSPTVALLLLPVVQQPRETFNAIADQTMVEFSYEQQRRLRQLGDFLSGNVTGETTTGRTEIWDLGIERIVEALPAGHGLGSFHFLEGGHFENGVWQGVHNTFLMLWGEAGILAFLLFTAFCCRVAWSLLTRGSLNFEIGFGLVILAVLMTGHNSLALRFLNLMMGVLIGVLTVSQGQIAGPRKSAPEPKNRRHVRTLGSVRRQT